MIEPKRCAMVLALVMAGLALVAGPALAGIPQPGLMLYGKVLDESGALVTSGEVVWTYTPQAGGAPVAITAALRPLQGVGGPYSYRVVLPFESAVAGYPVTAGSLPVTVESVSYTREGRLVSGNVSMTHVVTLSGLDSGNVQRVDLCLGCGPTASTFHSADLNADFTLSLDEVFRVIELHASSLSHDYHVDPAGIDGYAPGEGAVDGSPHTGDYYGGPDWRITVQELVRVFDLFASTNSHAYLSELASEDGFRKNDAQPYWQSYTGPGLAMRRTVSGGRADRGRTLDITVWMDFLGGETVSALGIFEPLPQGWTYSGCSGALPLVSPPRGCGDELHFAWLEPPAFPCSFTYTVAFPEGADVAADFCELLGEGVYRTVWGDDKQKSIWFGDEGPFADTDGDGLADGTEPAGDADRDGIPNFLDVDSDNDGMSDIEEVCYDANPDYNPYDPVTNPTGTDLNPYDNDTDGDGIRDGSEIAFGTDPLAEEPGVSVPAAGLFGLSVLAALLAAAGYRRRVS